MEVVILADAKEIGGVAADAIGALLDRNPSAVLGLATGSSPLAIYDELAARCDAGAISFRQARGFSLQQVGWSTWFPFPLAEGVDSDSVLTGRMPCARLISATNR